MSSLSVLLFLFLILTTTADPYTKTIVNVTPASGHKLDILTNTSNNLLFTSESTITANITFLFARNAKNYPHIKSFDFSYHQQNTTLSTTYLFNALPSLLITTQLEDSVYQQEVIDLLNELFPQLFSFSNECMFYNHHSY